MSQPRSALGAPPQGGAPGGPAEPVPRRPLGDASLRLDERSLSKLRWRCRRGLLENDLFIERFFRHQEETITIRQAEGLGALMDLADNDLLDLLLARKEPDGPLDVPEVREVLAQMRRPPPHPSVRPEERPAT
jgi:antitoxin CptB